MAYDPDQPNDLDKLKRLDAIAEAFELAWNSEKRPEVEEFARKQGDVSADRLVRELVELEIELRFKANESPTSDEYATRFPELDREWIGRLIDEKSAHTKASSRDLAKTIDPASNPSGANDSKQPTLAPLSRGRKCPPGRPRTHGVPRRRSDHRENPGALLPAKWAADDLCGGRGRSL